MKNSEKNTNLVNATVNGSKSATAKNTTLKSGKSTTKKRPSRKDAEKEHNALVESIVEDTTKQLKQEPKQPTPEELAEKALKSALSNSKHILKIALKGYREEHNDLKEHMKVLKKHLPSEYAKQVQDNWTRLTIETKKAGDCYLEEIVVEMAGKKQTLESVHMCEWKSADKTAEIGRKITITGYRYRSEDITIAKSVKDLTIERSFVKTDYVSLGTINGVESFKKVEKTITKKFRPVEVLTLKGSDFEGRLRKAWEIVFPNGIEKVTSKK